MSETLADDLGLRVIGPVEIEETYQHLDDLVANLSTMTKDERVEAVAGLLGARWLPRLSTLAREAGGAWDAYLVRLRASRGLASAVDQLRRRVRAEGRGLRLVAEKAAAPLAGVPDGWRAPPGWRADASGVWGPDPVTDDLVQLSTVPLAPVGRLLDVDTGDHHVRLSWPGWSGHYERTVRQSVTVDGRSLVSTLGDRGAGVTSRNASALVGYLDAALATNADRLPVELVASRCGWVSTPRASGFLLGRRWYGSGAVALQVDPGGGEEQVVEAVATSGTWDGWLASMSTAADCPDVHLAVYASVASVLVGRLGTARGWVVDWSGETSQGKTTALRVAASVWGQPIDGRMLQSWRLTVSRAEGVAHLLSALPLILDDSKNARSSRDVAGLIYQHSQGQAKGRAKPGAGSQAVGLRRSATWSSIMLSTGEQSAVSFTQDAGSRARCLCLVGPPLRSDRQARDLTVGILDHYGHLGERVIERLAGYTSEDWRRLGESYRQSVEAWVASLAEVGAVAQRLGALLALLEVARDLVEDVGYPEPPEGVEPLTRASEAVRAGGEDADRPLAALRAVCELATQHQEAFDDGASRSSGPPGGYLGRWEGDEIGVLPRVLDDWLARAGYDAGIRARWRERGWVERRGRDWTVKRQVGTRRVRLLVLTPEAVAVGF